MYIHNEFDIMNNDTYSRLMNSVHIFGRMSIIIFPSSKIRFNGSSINEVIKGKEAGNKNCNLRRF